MEIIRLLYMASKLEWSCSVSYRAKIMLIISLLFFTFDTPWFQSSYNTVTNLKLNCMRPMLDCSLSIWSEIWKYTLVSSGVWNKIKLFATNWHKVWCNVLVCCPVAIYIGLLAFCLPNRGSKLDNTPLGCSLFSKKPSFIWVAWYKLAPNHK